MPYRGGRGLLLKRMMTDTGPDKIKKPRRRAGRRRGRFGLWLLFSLALLVVVAGFGVLGLTGKPLRLPVWAVVEAEERINRAMGGEGAVSIGDIVVVVDEDWVPRLRLEDVRLMQPGGATLAQLPELRMAFDPAALSDFQIRPRSLRLIGARLTLRRQADGRFDLDLGGRARPQVDNFAQLLDLVEGVFALPAMSHLRRIEAEALTLTLDDRRAKRVWQVGDGRIRLENRPDELAMEVGLGLVAGGQTPARAVLTFVSQKGSAEARIGATIDQVAASDIAAQAPVLAWLGVLDAPISGTLHANIDMLGEIGMLEGSLQIAKGALQPIKEARPIAFDQAGLFFTYDKATEKIVFSELKVESASLRLVASGHTYMTLGASGRPDALLSQVRFSEVMLDPEGLFEEPLRFSGGALDLRLRLDPFSVDIGQLSLVEEGRRLTASGKVGVEPEGWTVAIDLALNEIRHDRLLALWPVALVPKTREWVSQNVQEGLLFDVRGGLRLRPGVEPRLSLGYEFAAADVQFLKTLPPIRDGYGYSSIEGTTYTLVLNRGKVIPPLGGVIDVANSVFRVPDITIKPAPAEITLRTRSSITAALSLLDEPPFEFLKKAGRPVELGTGRAEMEAVIRLPLKRKVLLPDVDYSITGTLTDVVSSVLMPGRVLTSDSLTLTADRTGLRIGGQGKIGEVKFDATWAQRFGPEHKGKSRVEGKVELSQAFLDEFGVDLPTGSVSGEGEGTVVLDLQSGGAGQFQLASDLAGIGLSIPGLGWSLPRDAAGQLEVAGRLGKPVIVDRLVLEAPGLSAVGSVRLKPDGGGLDAASFSRVRLNGWLDAPVELVGRGKGRPVGVNVSGGTADLRRMSLGKGSGGGGGPLTVALDRLSVSEGISLTGFRGTFSSAGGLNGTFAGRVNGEAPVSGTLVPSANGSAVRLTSDDAGAVLAAAGVFSKMRGGSLDLVLTPRGPKGDYDGHAKITQFRVRNAPVLAELLSAVSVVGMLEQLGNDGLAFGVAEADFRLTPAAIEITRGAAVGASLGVSMAGVYDASRKRIDMQGVISPVYLVNGIGSILTRRGEGLFGFNYRIAGPSEQPGVSVNPLSILTPGMFREIFRAPPPSLAEGNE